MRAPSGFWFGLTALFLSATVASQIAPAPASKTLEWFVPGDTSNIVTGIVSATNPAGPWKQECRFPAQATNFWTFNCDQPARFFRAFTDYAP